MSYIIYINLNVDIYPLEQGGKQQKSKQRKPGQQKQKEEEKKEKGEKSEEKEKIKKKKLKKSKTIDVKKVVEEWETLDKEEEAAKSENKGKKLVPKQFHKWIKMFGKKASKRILTRKIQDHVIDLKEGFVPRKGQVYFLSKEEREKIKKTYIRPSKSLQTAPVFFIGKKDGKKRMV